MYLAKTQSTRIKDYSFARSAALREMDRLIERYQVRNTQALKFFLKRLSASHSKQVSVNRLYNDLKSAGISVGKTSLYEFMEAAEAIFFTGILKNIAKKSAQESWEKEKYI